MTRRTSLVIAAALLLAAIAIACKTNQTSAPPAKDNHPASQATPDQFAEVRTIYGKQCQNCHGETGTGGPVKLEDGTKLKVPTFREGHALRHPDSDYVKQITKGGDGMPAFEKKLTPDQIDDLIKFIRREFQGGMTPPPEKSPMKNMKS